MASHIQNVTIKSTDGSPKVSYKVSYDATRNGGNVTYAFTIQCLLHGSSSALLGTGSGLKCTLTINGASSSVTLKSTSDSWKGGSDAGVLQATKEVSVTCASNSGNQNQTVKFVVDRTDSSDKTSGEVNTSDYYVISPAYYTACTAPTSFTASPSVTDRDVTLAWSGASGGVNNAITGYEIQFATSADGTSWSGWVAVKTVTGTTTTDSIGIERGYYEKYRIRTRGAAGSSYYSGWKESNKIQRANPVSYIHNGVDNIPHKAYIHNGTEFVRHIPYIHNGNEWVKQSG